MNSETNFVMLCARAFFSAAEIPLLRSALAQPPGWQSIDHQADRQCVSPIVAHALLQHAGDLLPEQVIASWKDKVRDITRQNLIWLQEWQHLLQLLEEAAIPVISFKGPALALTAYGDLTLREFHDLDLLVHPGDVVRARDILLGTGYTLWTPVLGDSEQALLRSNNRQLRFTHPTRGTTVDLHWGLLHEMFSFQLELDDVFAAAKLERREEATFLALSPEHSLLYLCAHGAKNCWAHLSELCDIAAQVRGNTELNWENCIRLAESSGCDRLLKHALLLAERVLQIQLPEAAKQYCSQDENAIALSKTAESFLFLHAQEVPGYWRTLQYHLAFAKTQRERARFIVSRVFAPAEPDWDRIRLPRQLFFLYYLIRPLRFLQEQTTKLARSQR